MCLQIIKIKQASVQKCPVYLCLPWPGGIREGFTKQISQTVQRNYFSAHVQVVFHSSPILKSIRKNVLPSHHNNPFTYLFMCSCCLRYRGRTHQRVEARIKHVSTKIRNSIGAPIDNRRNTYGSSLQNVTALRILVWTNSLYWASHTLHFIWKYWRQFIFYPAERLSLNRGNIC